MDVVLFLVIGAGALAFGIYAWRKALQRRQAISAFAAAHGLSFSERDQIGFHQLPFQLFSRGDGRGAENVMWGSYKGLECRAGDFWYYTESTDSKGNRQRNYRRFTCFAMQVPAQFPGLEVARENIATRLADHAGMRDIEFEIEEFNKAFNVKSRDRKFATDFCDQRMIRFLLSIDRRYALETAGPWIMVYSRKLKAEEIIPLFETGRILRDRVPGIVWQMYSPDGDRGTVPSPRGLTEERNQE